eukprot:CAMPEP_0169454840 /NCGR_PEP_ID=MMETSP1042-20121227/15494_1 /TAXON_ID=464988 /ORGANISM="Hemiselmis andersenii, Strain CCMP1180" /LENGTH=215 /DNA_ID=CAMNT_0009566943 /DNA_START=87 /DNA_END=731 /DNA_ORIENTATION=-
MSAEDETEGAELIGTLRRKKDDHGMFEDAWKNKWLCWIKGDMLHMRPTASGLLDGAKKGSFKGARETFPLTLWNVEALAEAKFCLIRPGGQQVRLRADSQAESELWVKKLTESMSKAKKEKRDMGHQHAMKMAQQELEDMKRDKEREEQRDVERTRERLRALKEEEMRIKRLEQERKEREEAKRQQEEVKRLIQEEKERKAKEDEERKRREEEER